MKAMLREFQESPVWKQQSKLNNNIKSADEIIRVEFPYSSSIPPEVTKHMKPDGENLQSLLTKYVSYHLIN